MDHDVTDDVLDGDGAGATALRGSVLRSGGYILGITLSLVSAPLIIRHLGLDGFGVFVTITAIIMIITGASELGLTAVGIREWTQRPQSKRAELLADLLGARIALTLVGIAGAFVFSLLAGYGPTRLAAVGVACFGLLVNTVQAALVVPLAAALRQGRIAGADLLRQASQVALIVAVVASGGGLVLLLATATPAAVLALVVTIRGVPGGVPRPAFHPKRWYLLLRDTLPFAAASAVSVIYFRVTLILTSVVATEVATGEFGAAFRVLEVLVNVPSLLVGTLFPLLARAAVNDSARLKMALERTWAGAVAVGGIAGVSVAAGAPLAILILSGEQEGGAVDSLRVLAVGLAFAFVGSACQYGLLSMRRHKEILWINGVALVLNVVLTLVLASAHGAVGAAIALGICEIAIAIAASTLMIRAGGLDVDKNAALRILLASAFGVLVTVLLTPVSIVVVALVVPVATLGVALMLKAIPHEIVALVRRRAA